jgi:hypothetical protein
MPITINGSGTVTGITAGGLPDGVITTDDIAASAITRAKMGYAGAILQVVQATYAPGSSASTTSTSFVNSGIECSITPVSSASKVLVMSSFIIGNGDSYWNHVSLFRGSTNLASALQAGQPQFAGNYSNGVTDFHNTASIHYLDSPATTSSTTYYIKFKSSTGSSVRICTDGMPGVIILMEVAA